MAGRKNAYEETIVPRLDEIRKCLSKIPPMTERQTAVSIGVSYSTWNKYKKEKPEFAELIKKAREPVVQELYSAIGKLALGFTYAEKKTIKKNGKVLREETVEKYSAPNLGAIHLCLKNWAQGEWANDPAMLEIKGKELKLREKELENKTW